MATITAMRTISQENGATRWISWRPTHTLSGQLLTLVMELDHTTATVTEVAMQ